MVHGRQAGIADKALEPSVTPCTCVSAWITAMIRPTAIATAGPEAMMIVQTAPGTMSSASA